VQVAHTGGAPTAICGASWAGSSGATLAGASRRHPHPAAANAETRRRVV